MRTTWNGNISFGLVNIPVGLAPATKPAARQSDVSFRMLHRECGTPIKQKRWCPVHERDVESDELVRGWEVAKGQFVHGRGRRPRGDRAARHEPVDRDRQLRAARGRSTRSTSTARTSSCPAGAEAARRPYVLLHEAMQKADVAALGRFVLAGKEKLCLIRPMGDALALETLFVHEDVKDHAEIDEAVAGRRGQGAGARAREADHRVARRAVRSRGAEERVPRAHARAARGEARGPRDRDAGGGGADAGRRPDGGAARIRRRRLGRRSPPRPRRRPRPASGPRPPSSRPSARS